MAVTFSLGNESSGSPMNVVSVQYYRKSVLHLLKYRFAVYIIDAVQICGKFWDTQYIKC